MSIAAVIVTHNNAGTIAKCIRSLLKHGIAAIIVVDSGSRDKTQDVVKNFYRAHLVARKNEGFATAANAGVTACLKRYPRTEYVLFINPDAELLDPIEPVLQKLETETAIGIIGLSLRDAGNNVELNSFGSEPRLFNMVFRRRIPSSAKLHASNSIVDWVSGGAMCVRVQAGARVGWFDTKFFLYWEDIDLCRRIRESGWQVLRMNTPRVLHSRGHSMQDAQVKARVYDTSAGIYFNKHRSRGTWITHSILRYLYRLLVPEAR